MPYSNEVYNIAKDRLSERRQRAISLADSNREQLYQKYPRFREINSELMSIGASIAKCVLGDGDNKVTIHSLSERSLALQEEQSNLLTAVGINQSVLEPHFHCEKCQDTGYIEYNNHTAVCDCLTKLMAEVESERLSANLPLDKCKFENFSLDYYASQPDENGKIPYSRMSKIFDYCVNYAENFTSNSKSILMRGATGLGKTHLSLAIANRVIDKGLSAIYVSAPDILSQLEREHFTYKYDKQEDTFSALLKCDLLIVDDLGTEFVSPFTVSCVYNLFNSRILSEKPIIINTNLTMTELLTTYSQRFVSRLIGACDTLDFIGEDVRLKK